MRTFQHMRNTLYILLLACWAVSPLWGATVTSPANLPAYYSGANSKSGSALVSALTTIARTNIDPVTYGSGTCTNCVWGAYGTTDLYPTSSSHPDYVASKAGKIWDIYADCNYTFQTDQGSSSATECTGGYNREHSMPKSWFGGGTSIGPGTDLFHIYPADVHVNTLRNNYPFGLVGSPTYTSTNGGKYGNCTWPSGYTGLAFEPADYLKGDLARGYFYMLITWNAYNTSTYSFTQDSDGNGAVTFNDNMTSAGHFGLTDFGLQLLLKWHREDPVSQKEIDRNNAVQSIQGNRNPFIDYPCLVEYIWGDQAGSTVTISSLQGTFDSGFTVGSDDGCSCGSTTTLNFDQSNVFVNKGSTVTNVATTNSCGAVTYTSSNPSVAIVSSSGVITGKAEGTCTITASVAACSTYSAKSTTCSVTVGTSYSVTWMANGSTYHSATVQSGASPSVPTAPDNCSSSRIFMGWTAQSGYSNASSAPGDLFTTTAPTVSSNTTFYAVYATRSSGGSSTATFDASDLTATPETDDLEWTHTASGIVLSLTAGQRYTSGTPNTFSVTKGTSNYAQLTSPVNMTRVEATISGNNYKINNVSSGWNLSTSGTTQIITSSGATELTMYATSGYQIRLVELVVTYSSYTYSDYSTYCTTIPPVTVSFNANGGTGTMASQSVPTGVATALNANTFTREGYDFDGWATTAGGAVVYTDGGNITTSVNITLYAHWTPKPNHTATFINNGASYATFSTYEGGTITTPTDPTPCDGYTFVGWSTNTYAADNTSAPSINYSNSMPGTDITYYAVFSKTEGGAPTPTNNYEKITSTDDLTSGSNYVIAAYYSSKYYALNTTVGGGGSSAAYLGTTVVAPSADVITTTDETIIWQITKSGSYLRFYNADAGKYLYTYTSGGGYGGTKYNLGLTSGTTGVDYSYTFSAGEWTLKSGSYSSYYVEQYSGKYQMYTSNGNPISIYKQVYEGGSITYYTTSPSCVAPLTGELLDIVDWTATTLTINATGFASSGWPYNINGTPYASSAREPDRTLIIPCSAAADETFRIEVVNNASAVVSRQDYTVPHIYESSATLSGTSSTSVVIVRGGTLTVNANTTLAALYVAPEAELIINSGKTLTVGKLVLRTTPWKAAVLTNNGTVNATNTYYTRIIADKSQFYWFALPLASNTSAVTLSDGSSCAVASDVAPYGQAWILRYYDTSSRAANGKGEAGSSTNWVNLGASGSVYSDASIAASRGYELFSNSNYYREYYFPVTLPTTATSVSVTYATGAAGAMHAGWNILCSPYTHTHPISISDPATAIKICRLEPDGSYTQTQPTSLSPVIPFAYQASGNGSLHFETNSFTFSAPRRRIPQEEETETEWLQLLLIRGDETSDETSLFAHPTRFGYDYEAGIDVAKQSLTAMRPLLYSMQTYGEMAFAGVSDAALENGVPLVVYSPNEQELSISLGEKEFLNRLSNIYLLDNETGDAVDLLYEDYTFTAAGGTTSDRFVLQGRYKSKEITTGLDLTKVAGQMYLFDALGHLVYSGNAADQAVLPPLQTGVYILRTSEGAQKIVILQ